jgi:medium-chain acyl-[acyl-carrier-protein] hydrolase
LRHLHTLQVQSFQIDCFGNVTIPSLFWYMQEIAWEHAQMLGFGFEHLREDQLFWVLSRFLVQADRWPRWTETLNLETWSRGTDGFFAYRDFRFTDSAGKEIILATSSWLVLDLGNKRIQRLNGQKNFPVYQESILGNDPGKIESPRQADALHFTPAQFNELDINQHINSGRYLERISNSYAYDFHKDNVLKEMEINFLKEGLPLDRLAVKRQMLNDQEHLCSLVRESDGADIIRSRLRWGGKSKKD